MPKCSAFLGVNFCVTFYHTFHIKILTKYSKILLKYFGLTETSLYCHFCIICHHQTTNMSNLFCSLLKIGDPVVLKKYKTKVSEKASSPLSDIELHINCTCDRNAARFPIKANLPGSYPYLKKGHVKTSDKKSSSPHLLNTESNKNRNNISTKCEQLSNGITLPGSYPESKQNHTRPLKQILPNSLPGSLPGSYPPPKETFEKQNMSPRNVVAQHKGNFRR